MYDVIIIGGGIAGLQAAIYASMAGKKTLVLEKGWHEGFCHSLIKNLLGFPKGIRGKDLLKKALQQAKKFHTEFKKEEVIDVIKKNREFEVKTVKKTYSGKNIMLTTGKIIKPSIKNENKFAGKGISYCVHCDAFFFRDKKVAVIGNSNLAASKALELLDYTKKITIFTNGQKFSADKKLIKKLNSANIKLNHNKIMEIIGDTFVKKLILENREEEIDGIFIATGFASSLDFAKALGLATKGEFLEVNEQQQTSDPNVYAAGDCTGHPFQIGKAIGEATTAALALIKNSNTHATKEGY